jgi:squalene-hopene/tetraprenyl-beta-curcumene cyclase
MKATSLLGACLAPLVVVGIQGRVKGEEADALEPSFHKDALRALRIGLKWLKQQQAEDGHWSNDEHPAVTALVVWANLRSPDVVTVNEKGFQDVEVLPHVQKGIDYILSCVNQDGGIYKEPPGGGGALKNYNTAVCMAALAATGDARYEQIIVKARRFLIGLQYLGGGKFDGGMGYEPQDARPYADMSNTYVAIESIRFTDFVRQTDYRYCLPPRSATLIAELERRREQSRNKGEEGDLNWDRAIRFLSRCQNLPEANSEPWVSQTEDDRGGFVYHPGKSMAGEALAPDGGRYLRSYGSMTYAGLLSFIHAEVHKDDYRVTAAYDWIRRHFTLDENPGMGLQGLYYNYHTMAKALTAYGEDILELPDGKKVDWRSALVQKLISLQRIDPKTGFGYWVNEHGRWWENDPVLVTAYALLALEICMQGNAP